MACCGNKVVSEILFITFAHVPTTNVWRISNHHIKPTLFPEHFAKVNLEVKPFTVVGQLPYQRVYLAFQAALLTGARFVQVLVL